MDENIIRAELVNSNRELYSTTAEGTLGHRNSIRKLYRAEPCCRTFWAFLSWIPGQFPGVVVDGIVDFFEAGGINHNFTSALILLRLYRTE